MMKKRFKREKFIIQPGKICTFDAKNLLKRDSTSLITVEVIKCVRGKLFGTPWWRVTGCGHDKDSLPEPIDVPEYLLFPEGMCIIRNPTDFPVINDKDIRLINEIIYYFENPPKDDNVSVLTIKKESLDRLKALLTKMVLSKSMREV
jgi:hypothetical protein